MTTSPPTHFAPHPAISARASSVTGRRVVKAWRCAGNSLWRRSLLGHGVAAATEHASLVHAIRPDLVLDVGANRGQFTLLVKGLLPSASVVAFEPGGQALTVLRRVAAGLDDVAVVPVACGAARGTARLHVARDDDNSSLLAPTAQQTAIDRGASTAAREPVEVAPLADLVDHRLLGGTSLLKIDVQGTELDVLRGAAGIIGSLTYLYVELSFVERYIGQSRPAEVVRHLDGAGFELVHLHNPVRRSTAVVQADALFARAGAGRWSPLLAEG